jgi:hypothetical protein
VLTGLGDTVCVVGAGALALDNVQRDSDIRRSD